MSTVAQTKPKKTAAAKKPLSHPTFAEMITEAITSLKERTGSSQYAITKFIEEKHKDLPPTYRKLVLLHLKKSVASGKLVKVKSSFKLAPAAAKTAPAAATKAPKAVTKPSAKAVTKPKAKAAGKPKAKAAAKPKAVAKPKAKSVKATPVKKAVAKKVVKKAKSVKSPAKKVKSVKTPVKKAKK
uniref:His7 protein n=1 Tax=Lathyrus oleraceus subsp. biflorus TaxID=47742 RepID=S6D6E5_PEA|nr:histone H1 subtype 7 [Pisum sativum subsp. elatius]